VTPASKNAEIVTPSHAQPETAGACAVVDRLRAAYGAESDAALARALGVGTSTVRNWRDRESVPYPHCVTAAQELGVGLDWLLLGRAGDAPDAVRDAAAPPYQAAGPPGADDDDRLGALLDWLRAVWDGATEEERAWLVVELRLLRRRLRDGGA